MRDATQPTTIMHGGQACVATRDVCDALLQRHARHADLDDARKCSAWAVAGECRRNERYMRERCCLSCVKLRCMALDHDNSTSAAATLFEPRRSGEDESLIDAASGRNRDRPSTHFRDDILARHAYSGRSTDPCAATVDEEQVYGEIAHAGMGGLVRSLAAVPSCALTEDSTFYDIGSGLGRLAWYVRATSRARRVVGVEINRCRHERALAMRADALMRGPAAPALWRNLSFVNADVRTRGFGDATHAFVTPICFSRGLLRELVARAARQAREEQLRCLIVFGQPLPAGEAEALAAEGRGLAFVGATPLAATFQSQAFAFFYSRTLGAVPPTRSGTQHFFLEQ